MGATRVNVPFVDLKPSHEDLKAILVADFEELLETGAFVNGDAVADFEYAFAGYVGRARCVGTASGLDALRLALIAAHIDRGDEVLVPVIDEYAMAHSDLQRQSLGKIGRAATAPTMSPEDVTLVPCRQGNR